MFVFIQGIITYYCHYLFSCSSCPRLGHWELPPVVPVSFQYASTLSLSTFIFSVLIYTGNTFRIANAIPMKNKLQYIQYLCAVPFFCCFTVPHQNTGTLFSHSLQCCCIIYLKYILLLFIFHVEFPLSPAWFMIWDSEILLWF